MPQELHSANRCGNCQTGDSTRNTISLFLSPFRWHRSEINWKKETIPNDPNWPTTWTWCLKMPRKHSRRHTRCIVTRWKCPNCLLRRQQTSQMKMKATIVIMNRHNHRPRGNQSQRSHQHHRPHPVWIYQTIRLMWAATVQNANSQIIRCWRKNCSICKNSCPNIRLVFDKIKNSSWIVTNI